MLSEKQPFDLAVNMHFSDNWEQCLTKFLKSIPENLKYYQWNLYVDISSICNDFKNLNDNINKINNLTVSFNIIKHYTIGGLKNNMYFHCKSSKYLHSLLCEFDFIFTKNFNINFDFFDNKKIDFLFFEREKYQNYTPIIEKIEINNHILRKVNYYSNNNFIVNNNIFCNIFSEIHKNNQHFSAPTGSRGIEIEFLNHIQNNKHYEQFYYGEQGSGPYIFHIDSSNNYENFDMFFKKTDDNDMINLTKFIQIYTDNHIKIKINNRKDLLEYVQNLCLYNNINLEIAKDNNFNYEI